MTFEYTGRHVEVTPAIRRHVEDQFRKLEHIFNGTNARVHVILEVEKNRQTGEVIVKAGPEIKEEDYRSQAWRAEKLICGAHSGRTSDSNATAGTDYQRPSI